MRRNGHYYAADNRQLICDMGARASRLHKQGICMHTFCEEIPFVQAGTPALPCLVASESEIYGGEIIVKGFGAANKLNAAVFF